MENSNRYLPLLGRIMIGAPFILSGLGKLMAHDATVGYIGSVGLPLPQVAWLIALLVEIGGGALLIGGFRARFVALGMAVFALDGCALPAESSSTSTSPYTGWCFMLSNSKNSNQVLVNRLLYWLTARACISSTCFSKSVMSSSKLDTSPRAHSVIFSDPHVSTTLLM